MIKTYSCLPRREQIKGSQGVFFRSIPEYTQQHSKVYFELRRECLSSLQFLDAFIYSPMQKIFKKIIHKLIKQYSNLPNSDKKNIKEEFLQIF